MVLKFKTVVACGFAALAVLSSAWAAEPRNIDLPSQEAARAIAEFGRQANVQIIAPVSRLHGMRTPAVRGRLTVEEALRLLLVGTGLEVAANDGVTIVLRQAAGTAAPSPDGASPQPLKLETVTVTGSRLITDAAISPTPVTEVSTEQLQRTTPSDLPDALNKLPAILGGRNPRTQGNGSANNAGNVLALRGFGAARTLVLLDGRRLSASNQDGTVNIDTLPQMLIERVDIVTGGASAVYGSDAVAGVINFVLDKDFTGFRYNMNAGISGHGDAAEWQAGAAWGSGLFGGRAHLEMAARYRSQDMVPIQARPYGRDGQAWLQAGAGTVAAPFVNVQFARTFNMSPHGTVNCGAACLVNDHTFRQPGLLSPMAHGLPTGTANLEAGGDGGYVRHGTFRSRVRTAEWFGRFDAQLGGVEAHLQAGWAEAGNWSDWVNWVVSSAANRPNTLFADNPFLAPSTQAALGAGVTCGTPAAAGWFCLPSSPPISPATGSSPPPPPTTPYFHAPSHAWSRIGGADAAAQNRLYSTVGLQRSLSLEAGLAGMVQGLGWELYYSHGESRLKVTNPANTDNARYLAALDAVIAPAGTMVNGRDMGGTVTCWVTTQPQFAALYPGCVPANIADPAGPSAAAFEYLKQPTAWTLTQVMDNAGGAIRGELFGLGLAAGEIEAALSAEARWTGYHMNSRFLPTDFVDCTGLRMCLANGAAPVRWVQNVNAPVDARNIVYEVALELNVPLLKDMVLARDLSLDLAGRHTDYSTSGAAQTWKLGANWHVDSRLHFRGTMSVDIRAPNLNDLYQPAGISSTGFTDLLTGGNRSTQLVSRGNPALRPEVARTLTAGLVLTPVSGLRLSLDWYATRMSSAITNISYQNVAVQNICLASAPSYDSPFCALAVRPITDPTHADYRNPAVNFPVQILNAPLNAARQEMEGFDIEFAYRWEVGDIVAGWTGSVTLRHLLTYQPVNSTINIPGAFPTWPVAPKTRQTSFLQYDRGAWRLALQNQWLAGVKKASSDNALNGNTQNYAVPRLGSWNVLDVSISRRFAWWGGQGEVYLTINNVGDTRAPLLPSGAGIPGLFYPAAGFHDDMGRYFTLGLRGQL